MNKKILLPLKKIKRRLMNPFHLIKNNSQFKKRKIFTIGFNKTGTTSIHHLYEKMGFNSHHGMQWRDCDNFGKLLMHDCFSDGIPWDKDYQILDNYFPNAKFILQVRDLDKWVYSNIRHYEGLKKRNKFKKEINVDLITKLITYRNQYHIDVLSYFKN
jgi:hypothetical protein